MHLLYINAELFSEKKGLNLMGSDAIFVAPGEVPHAAPCCDCSNSGRAVAWETSIDHLIEGKPRLITQEYRKSNLKDL